MLVISNVKYLLKLIVIFTCFLCIGFYSISGAKAYFREDFNNQFSHPTSWVVNNPQGLSFSSSSMNLANSSNYFFPYVRTASPIVTTNDDYLEVGFQFTSAGGFGDGIAITDELPPVGVTMTYPSKFSQYTLFYIWQNYLPPYFHIATSLCPQFELNCLSNQIRVIYSSSQINLSNHIVRFSFSGNVYSVSLDDTLIFTSAQTNRFANNVWFGHPETTITGDTWSSLSIDYLQIGVAISSPSPSPTPSPSPSPLPSLVPSSLPSPDPGAYPFYLSQLDSLWKNNEYDSARLWAGSSNAGIGRWGCALTSVAMILKSYDIKFPNNGCQTTDPGILNQWLIDHNGYDSKGGVFWGAVEKFTKNSYSQSCAPTKLEHNRVDYNPDELKSSLNAGYLSILKLPNHFVLATAENDANQWKIADPALKSQTTLSKNADIVRVERFVPTNSDFSGIQINTSEKVKLELFSNSRKLITSGVKDGLVADDEYPNSGFSPSTTSLLMDTPETGRYILKVTNTGDTENFDLEAYVSDVEANEQIWKNNIHLEAGAFTYLFIDFDKDDIAETRYYLPDDGFRALVRRLYFEGEIGKRGVANHLENYHDVIETFEGKLGSVASILDSIFTKYINKQNETKISSTAKVQLTDYLRTH